MQMARKYALTSDGAAVFLTEREEQVLAHVAAGFDHATITRVLGIRKSTTVTYMARLSEIAGARNRNELVTWALLTGLVAPPQIWELWRLHAPKLAAWQARELEVDG